MTDTIRFECASCGATFAEFREFTAHIGEHLRIQAAPLRTLRRTVRANKLMIASSSQKENSHETASYSAKTNERMADAQEYDLRGPLEHLG